MDEPQPGDPLASAMRRAALALAALFLLLFLDVALRRLHYPYEIDRIESGMMSSVWRLRHGFPLYTAPSLTWAPFLYAPLFFYLAAALSKVTGLSYAALRLVSILATLGTFGIIAALVWGETRRWSAAVIAAGFYASLYAYALGWFDVGRVDALSVFFFLAAILATRRGHPLLAAFVWLLAFETKQTFLPLGLAIFLVDWQRPRRMLLGMAAFAAMAAASIVWMNHVTGHWYSFYAFGTAGGLGWAARTAAMFPTADLLQPWPIVAALILFAAVITPLRWRTRDGSFFAIVTVLLVLAVWFVRAHAGANVNALLPLDAWMAVLAGVALHRLLALGEDRRLPLVATALWLCVALQLAANLYRPGQLLPSATERAQGDAFIAALRATPGDVWAVNRSYDGILAGKPMHAEMDALDAILGRGYAPALAELDQSSRTHRFAAIVLDAPAAAYAPRGIFTTGAVAAAYPVTLRLPQAEGRDQPLFVLLPNPPPPNAFTPPAR